MSQHDLIPYLLSELTIKEFLLSPPAILFGAVVFAIVAVHLANLIFRAWLIRFVRPLSKDEFKRVVKVAQPEKDEGVTKTIIGLVKKWFSG